MSFKSLKSKSFKKAVVCTIVGTLSVCAIVYSGHQMAAVTAPDNVNAKNIDDDIVTTLPFITKSSTSTTSTTSSSTTTTANTTERSTTTKTTFLSTTDVVTSTITLEVTEPVTEAQTEVYIETPVETNEPEPEDIPEETEPPIEETTEDVREFVVYKPSTHYIHTSGCRWRNSECYEITSTEGIEARKCSECNPDMDIITPYEEPVTSTTNTAISVTDYEYIILCNLVAGEYGSDWVSTYDKGAVVATVIHRMWEGTRWTNGAPASIYNVIAAPYQYDGKYLSGSYSSRVTQSCKDAVTYALNNIGDYDYYTNPDGTTVYMINSFYGDGTYNWFRCS